MDADYSFFFRTVHLINEVHFAHAYLVGKELITLLNVYKIIERKK